MKTECGYLNGWIKNSHICKNLTLNGEPKSLAGNPEEEELTTVPHCGTNTAERFSQIMISYTHPPLRSHTALDVHTI